MLLINFSKYFI